MCNCLEEKIKLLESQSMEDMKKYYGLKSWESINSVSFKHTLEVLFSPLNIPVVIKGTNNKGKEVKKELYYAINNCPFCGKKIKQEEGK